ncbi:hypothetical protein F511_41308 [Dorcoceras hygrometricum]|uniref:Uncharacterized protein n=1 Tax=Dorcoceras hygrometricum TaxID=472368 RepID=A0A2Z7C369_9LAMI|nr:hypothetical protein F511_41308 [Dorcoceras hygrometricum]
MLVGFGPAVGRCAWCSHRLSLSGRVSGWKDIRRCVGDVCLSISCSIVGQLLYLTFGAVGPLSLELVSLLVETALLSWLTFQRVLQLVVQRGMAYSDGDRICTRSLCLYLSLHSINALVRYT